jgi:hypothetical protein
MLIPPLSLTQYKHKTRTSFHTFLFIHTEVEFHCHKSKIKYMVRREVFKVMRWCPPPWWEVDVPINAYIAFCWHPFSQLKFFMVIFAFPMSLANIHFAFFLWWPCHLITPNTPNIVGTKLYWINSSKPTIFHPFGWILPQILWEVNY